VPSGSTPQPSALAEQAGHTQCPDPRSAGRDAPGCSGARRRQLPDQGCGVEEAAACLGVERDRAAGGEGTILRSGAYRLRACASILNSSSLFFFACLNF